jgi:hypothetical protein
MAEAYDFLVVGGAVARAVIAADCGEKLQEAAR